jgi:hypothetical protein
MGIDAKVLISDQNEDAVNDLIDSGLEKIELAGFDPKNSYSILKCKLPGKGLKFLLLDPFADFLGSAERLLSDIITSVFKNHTVIALFVISDESMHPEYLQFRKLLQHTRPAELRQFAFLCPRISGTGVSGEDRFTSDIILFIPKGYIDNRDKRLKLKLIEYAVMLSNVLDTKIQFKEII